MKQRTQKDQNNERQEQRMESDLHDLFLDQLSDLLNAETQLTKALPKMAKAAQTEELREAIESHLEETEEHVNRLKEVFESLGERAKSKTCPAMRGLIEEGTEIAQDFKGKNSIDAGIIAAAQKVEHYEIASYGTVLAWAEQMGHSDAARLLGETLEEEKAADSKLTKIAEEVANTQGEGA